MHERKRALQRISSIILLIIAIIFLFIWYTEKNRQRIEEQNLNYAVDCARQTAGRIEEEFKNASSQIKSYSYFLGKNLTNPSVSPEQLRDIEQNSIFELMRFTDTDGVNYTSDGQTSDATDRDYYLKGMQGESGTSVIFDSRINHETMMGFYTPLYYNGEIIGVLRGAHLAEKYLQHMLTASYFGETADVYLCMTDGTVIASSDGRKYDIHLIDSLTSSGSIDTLTAEKSKELFDNREEGSFICDPQSQTDNISIFPLDGTDYVLVQIFPKSITRHMVQEANRIGILLELLLILLFFLYIVIIIIQAKQARKYLEQKNLEMSYVTNGVNTLFSRFVMLDLERGTYHYLAGTKPEQADVPPNGDYTDFFTYMSSFLILESDREKFAELSDKNVLISRLGEENTDIRLEYHVRRNGQTGWEHMNIICLERQEGKASKVLFIRQNITETKERELRIQAEISLANRKERQYRVAITADSICTYDFNLTRDLIEKDIFALLRGKQTPLLEMAGLEAPCRASEWFRHWQQFILEESLEDYCTIVNSDYLRDSFAQGIGEVSAVFWNKDTNGQKLCVRQSFIMTQDDDTGDIIVLVVTKDITQQVEKQEEQTQILRDALMQAQHASKAKTAFLSNMSHDIRTPMNAIIGFSNIAISHIDNKEQVKDCLQKVLSSSNHLLSLINDILDMSRIESGKVQINNQECNISELMHSLVNIIQPQVKAKRLDLFIDTFDIANEEIIVDSLKLNQVLVNLMSNAIKYTPAGGTISLHLMQKTSLRQGFGDYIFTVKDNGIGMTQEFVNHIFEPFERESSTTKTGIQGTGLGMAITKNIIDMMGGTIAVQSELGKGTEFIVQLNLKIQDSDTRIDQIKELSDMRVLVVDDDFNICGSVSKMLKKLGMRPDWTTSGREAVYHAKSAREEGDPYLTYIIDWQMPEMSGMETVRRIRKAVGNDVPIINLTAYDWTDIEEDAKAAGVTVFCAKPLFLSDLKSALLTANHLIEEKEESMPWTAADFSGKRLLLVEDIDLNREIAEEILSEIGFVIESAPDGTDAVEMMEKSQPYYYNAILMDVQMPVMNGYEATRTIRSLSRQDAKEIPIIAMTANAMEEDKTQALKSGMDAHISKPFQIDDLIAVLNQFLN